MSRTSKHPASGRQDKIAWEPGILTEELLFDGVLRIETESEFFDRIRATLAVRQASEAVPHLAAVSFASWDTLATARL